MSLAAVPTHRSLARGWRGTVLVIGLAALALALHVQSARAVILPATTIDGPSEDIVGFGGVAMATDGTGGVVYLKRVGGVPHVFVSRYAEGHWQAPIQVDRCRMVLSSAEQEEERKRAEKREPCKEPFAASWPRIGAAEGGELIVTWATQYALSPPPQERPRYEMLGAELGPGGERFGQEILIDRDIHEATGTNPELAVSSTGYADLVYRVVEEERQSAVVLRPGDVAETRARQPISTACAGPASARSTGTPGWRCARRLRSTRRASRSGPQETGSWSGRSPN